jgi:hypothetical protein
MSVPSVDYLSLPLFRVAYRTKNYILHAWSVEDSELREICGCFRTSCVLEVLKIVTWERFAAAWRLACLKCWRQWLEGDLYDYRNCLRFSAKWLDQTWGHGTERDGRLVSKSEMVVKKRDWGSWRGSAWCGQRKGWIRKLTNKYSCGPLLAISWQFHLKYAHRIFLSCSVVRISPCMLRKWTWWLVWHCSFQL